MTVVQKLVNRFIRLLLRTVCEINDGQIERIPTTGPLLIITNHINFLEVPLVATHFGDRSLVGVAKVESWDNPIKSFLFDMWGGIPVRRGEADRAALHQVLDALAEGKIVGLAPEGTRSYHGRLQIGHPGVLLMALRGSAPILPVVLHGHEYFWDNLRKLKRTRVYFEVGNAFRINDHGQPLTREIREQMTREVMYQMAALLPPQNRGLYSDLENASSQYLEFEPDVQNNLEKIRYGGYSHLSPAVANFPHILAS